ncbi:MAG: 3-deoxy-D-manno-octulosonic acid transferase [Gemmatimonadaceae bacterium]|nr:3-deoxy-D-manno-octulosonic acid transferase [Chitinophagaceae bacterium]
MGLILYRLFWVLYRAGAALISPWNPKGRLWIAGRKGIFPKIEAALAARPLQSSRVWMHCASLGEFEQGRPLVEELKRKYPETAVVISFFSPSGYEIRKDYPLADHVFYLPVDSEKNAERLISLIKPSLVLWVKYEYWHFYLLALKKAEIPVLLVSGLFRQSQPFFQWYGGFQRDILANFSRLFVQNQHSRDLLGSIGITGNVTVSGDTRFDRVIAIANGFSPIPLIDSFISGRPTLVAGSTWQDDEEEIDHFANTHPAMRFIIAPHEIDEPRLKEVESLFKQSARYSEYQKNPSTERNTEANVLIIDNIGMLSKLYHYATIAFIGGGFGDDGIHNVLEAAVYGKPIIHGPEYEKFAEATDLVDLKASWPVESAIEFEKVLSGLLSDTAVYNASARAAREYVAANAGATAKIMNYIQEKRLLTS